MKIVGENKVSLMLQYFYSALSTFSLTAYIKIQLFTFFPLKMTYFMVMYMAKMIKKNHWILQAMVWLKHQESIFQLKSDFWLVQSREALDDKWWVVPLVTSVNCSDRVLQAQPLRLHCGICSADFPRKAAVTEGNPPSSPPCFCTRKCRASVDGGSAAAARTMTWRGGFKGQRGGSRRWIGRTEAVCVCVTHLSVTLSQQER